MRISLTGPGTKTISYMRPKPIRRSKVVTQKRCSEIRPARLNTITPFDSSCTLPFDRYYFSYRHNVLNSDTLCLTVVHGNTPHFKDLVLILPLGTVFQM